nr:matrixin family metalloprotease [Bacteroidales bacterium]
RNELYGLKQSKTILNERLRKVIIHEIGHMFGLIHCQNPVCVMRSSTYVEDLDQKSQNLCIKCRTKIETS